MLEPAESECRAFHAFDQIVDRFGRPVAHVGAMPCDDLVPPSADRAAESLHFGRHLGVGEVAADVIDPGGGEVGIGVIVCLTDHFFGVPAEPDFAFRIAGGKESTEAFAAVVDLCLGKPRRSAWN